MRTQFAAIFSLAGALLTSPCVFGKELKDYNQGELKQAVQDVVNRLHEGYKEPFGTIMLTLGRSADNPWDGAGQSEKKPSDDTTPKPKKESKPCVSFFALPIAEQQYYKDNDDFINKNRDVWRMLAGLTVKDLDTTNARLAQTKTRFRQSDFTDENGDGKKFTYTSGSDGDIEQEVFLYGDGTVKIEFTSGGEIEIDSSKDSFQNVLKIKLPSNVYDSDDESESSTSTEF